ncbi:MAG TPA: ABC transporter substrate-binding protein [Micromonosporaceae bacterium]|nr:ABC transporter substrate-binding protein [Micromonosporaceae bacterium]
MSHMDRRQALKLLAALGATGLAAACGTNSNDARDDEPADLEPIRIGLIAPQTGGNKPIGDDLIRGFQLFLDLNDQRLGGHPVDLQVVDEGNDVNAGKAAVDKLLKSGVLALSGVVDSTVMLGIRDQVESARVPLIGSNASPSTLQSVVYIWRTSYVSDEPGRALGPYVARQVKNGEVAIVAPDYPAGKDAVDGFRQTFGRPGDPRIAAPTHWTRFTANPGKREYADVVAKVRERNPAAVYSVFSGAAAVAFVRELREAGYRNEIYGPGFLTEGTVLKELGEQALGIQTALNYSADLNNGANRRFATAFRKAHHASPTTYAVASYDAAQVLDKAIRVAGDRPTPQDVNLALGKVGQIDSPRGPWQFNQPRTPQQRWYLREVRKDGQVISNMLVNELTTLG